MRKPFVPTRDWVHKKEKKKREKQRDRERVLQLQPCWGFIGEVSSYDH